MLPTALLDHPVVKANPELKSAIARLLDDRKSDKAKIAMLRSMLPDTEPPMPPKYAAIVGEEAAAHGVTVAAMIGKKTKGVEARARYAAARRLRAEGLSYPQIGRILGMDHSSVYVAVNGVRAA